MLTVRREHHVVDVNEVRVRWPSRESKRTMSMFVDATCHRCERSTGPSAESRVEEDDVDVLAGLNPSFEVFRRFHRFARGGRICLTFPSHGGYRYVDNKYLN